jgi:hypothetical protein
MGEGARTGRYLDLGGGGGREPLVEKGSAFCWALLIVATCSSVMPSLFIQKTWSGLMQLRHSHRNESEVSLARCISGGCDVLE